MQFRVGTSGYSYAEWNGSFYPERLPARERLAHYGARLPAVEINNTFYRLPKPSVLETWAGSVPEHFRFVLKASRRITHFRRLKEAGDETGYLLRSSAVLGERLGPLLFQLPPNLRCDLERLERFLELLPEGVRAAFEFRHPSWQDDRVHALLADRALALCGVDPADDEGEPAEPPVQALEPLPGVPYGYVRLRRPHYSRGGLAAWAERLRQTGWDEAYVFFKHEEDGAGPRLALEFLELAERLASRKGPIAAKGVAGRDREAVRDREAG